MTVDLVLCVEEHDDPIRSYWGRVYVVLMSFDSEALGQSRFYIVPDRTGRWIRWWQSLRVVGVVVEISQSRRGGGVTADHRGCHPVVPGWILVGFYQDGVSLPRVDEEVLHCEWFHVVAIRLDHRHVVSLKVRKCR